MAAKCHNDNDPEVGQCDSAVELFYDNPKDIFENESDTDSETESETALTSELSDDLIELKDSFAAVKLQGRSLYNPKVPLRRAVSLQSGRSGKSRPILRIKPGLSSALSIAQMEEIKGLGIQDSLILRSMSMPLVGDTHDKVDELKTTSGSNQQHDSTHHASEDEANRKVALLPASKEASPASERSSYDMNDEVLPRRNGMMDLLHTAS